ncbi:class I SAM-dependent methyltransferase [Pelagicoccus sp. NFK12]|uniref:Class I SAM-dependent methyltransferase n=1 Tax=Pelagicoccus enzymogenes TaxID=2773457 RepID=A0A927FAR3_9BACT|nr:class I SAM-dependent methyltransferase [Pelagicoccus enzymogenes]MBD5780911.1 class I SAM-dependent methyltransferase [Pelagicoccus enzymogenes]
MEALSKPPSLWTRISARKDKQYRESIIACLEAALDTARYSQSIEEKTAAEIQSLRNELLEIYGRKKSESPDNDRFYLEFENRYRGTADEIRKKQEPYLNYIKELFSASSNPTILDCGCGRGEWLKLLRDDGFTHSNGVDCNAAMVSQCQANGLNVERCDILSYLDNTEPDALEVITAFHLVEHFPFQDLLRFLTGCYRSLRSNGIAILETPNPRNIIVGATTFHFDPTHQKPLPSELLSFACEHVGFRVRDILQLNAHPDLEAAARFLPQESTLLKVGLESGLDYGIVIQKP